MNRKEKVKERKKATLEVKTSQVLPNSLNVSDHVKNRLREIEILQKELNDAQFSSARRVFQQLPRHMRRRAASHNIKRLPIRLRQKAIAEASKDATMAPAKKSTRHMKHCRRWRRRSANSAEHFGKKKGWLETHLWHAKRCKMIDYWGFKVAAHLNEKCLKSSYRSFTHGTLLHDASYLQTYEITGSPENIKQFIGSCVKFIKCDIESGSVDGNLVIDQVELCPIRFVFPDESRAWILLHPAAVESGILENQLSSALASHTLALKKLDICYFELYGEKGCEVLNSSLQLPSDYFKNLSKCLLNVSDPRVKATVVDSLNSNDFWTEFDSVDSISSEAELNEQKSKEIIPGSITATRDSAAIVLIKDNLSGNINRISMLLPKVWARPIWRILTMTKPVKVAGIDSLQKNYFEFGIPVFPRDYAASPAHMIESKLREGESRVEYMKRPPAKRHAYEKLGIESPFRSRFECLPGYPKSLQRFSIELEGRGTIESGAEIFQSGILIGYVTSAVSSSLRLGKSRGVACVTTTLLDVNSNMTVTVKNYSSYHIDRIGILKPL